MTHSREDLAGVCLAGEYTLRRYLVQENSGPFFEAVGSAGEPVLVKLDPDAPSPEERVALWRRTAYLQHPHLLRLLDCGHSDQGIYAAMEWPDDHLAAGLEQGPLAELEARALLLAALDALRYLHAQGLVHGHVDANHVWAVGNTIKLSTDDLREPETGESPYAGDIRALGALVYQALTGREFAGVVGDIPEPFATIVRHTAGAKPADCWRIPEILAAVPPPVPEPPVSVSAPAPIVEAPPPAPTPEPDAVRAHPPALAPAPIAPRLPVWAWPASLAVVLGCIAWVLHTPKPKPAPQPAAAPVYAPAPQNGAPAVPPPSPPPVESAATEAEREAPVPQGRTVWRVIAYTYNAVRDAQRKVLAINRQWPGIHAEVFAPKGETHPPYLVALGGRMNRMDATKLLQKARSRGLPRDTFVLNFSN